MAKTHKFVVELQTAVLDNTLMDRISFLFSSVKLTRHFIPVIQYAISSVIKVKGGRLEINLFKHSLEQISRIEEEKKHIHVIS